MCTVLQQHLNRVTNGYGSDVVRPPGGGETTGTGSETPSTAIYHHHRLASPSRLSTPQPIYSYLQDPLSLKRPVDVYDRKISAPARLPHYHIPLDTEGARIPTRSRSTYMQQLYGRRSRSYSRTGMRVLVDELQSATPRARSPHMNNEEPINLSHYPDGRKPEEADAKKAAIERDDFPAPPFVYSDPKRRRRWSEPEKNQGETESEGLQTPVEESDENEEEFVDEKLDKNEAELRKISTGMCQVFLTEISIERERRRSARKRLIDPRSAARTPSANREPHYRLRYDSPVNASPSRIADHAHPWDDETVDGTVSRRSFTPFLPGNPGAFLGRAVSPVQNKSSFNTLPTSARYSPCDIEKTCSTDFSSKSDFSDGVGGGTDKQENLSTGLITPDSQTRPQSAGGKSTSKLNQSLQDMPDTRNNSISSFNLTAPNVYPLHLLLTTNYRLPADVDRNNLEKHLTDNDFDQVFKMSRENFYQMPYWKRCDIKRKHNLF